MALKDTESGYVKLIKNPAVLDVTGYSKSTLYNRITDGLFCPPIAIGPRAVAFVELEVQTVLKAMVASESEDQIRELVTSLISKRKLPL